MGDAFKVFLVFGQCGEYSDHTSWPVRGFLTRDVAERFEFALTKAAKAFHEEREERRPRTAWNDTRNVALYAAFEAWEKPELERLKRDDPGFQSDYTGTDYYTLEVEVSP